MNIGEVTISPFGSSTAGENATLMCSATITPNPLPSNVPPPTFEWFFGPNNRSGLTWLTAGLLDSGDTYTSILQFSPLNQSYAGKYTCRLGGNPRLAANTVLMVDGIYACTVV